MKLKRRKQLLDEYNTKYPGMRVYTDTYNELLDYFNTRGMNFDKAITKAAEKALVIQRNRKYRTIRITMYEYPMKTDRPRSGLHGFYSPNAKDNKKYFMKQVTNELSTLYKLINTPTTLQVDTYVEMPASVKADEIILFETKVLGTIDTPDVDNSFKCYSDMMQDVLLLNDDIICSATMNRYYSVKPRVEITISFISTHESDYIYRKILNRKSIKDLIAQNKIEVVKI